jgi:hypothetical protein
MRLNQQEAAGTPLTNSVTETRLGVYTVPIAAMAVGKKYHVQAQIRATATNGTDTLQPRLRVGGTTLTGTVIIDGTAVDVANDDVLTFDLHCVVRAVSATAGILHWHGFTGITGSGAATVTARQRFVQNTSLNNLTAAVLFEITGVWSVANAGNSCQLEAFDVDEYIVGKG